jgi:8-oxo-dGTP diphosphatase
MPTSALSKLIASAVIIRAGKVLIFEEKDDEGAEKYNLPGGHVEPGETPVEALLREVKEETGLDAAPVAFLQLIVNTWSKNHSVLLHFLVSVGEDEVLAETGTSVRWMTEEVAASLPDDRCVFGIKEAIRAAFARKGLPSEALLLRKGGMPVKWDQSLEDS